MGGVYCLPLNEYVLFLCLQAEDEMGGDIEGIDREQAFSSLAQTLTKMLEKLQGKNMCLKS